jgi:mannose/fructose/N-acetylgalactosamine-specific phosphotransferase system component IIC
VDNIWIGLIGSLLALDTTLVFQFLLSQPLVTSSILGWIMGDLQLGIEVGFYLQLLWLRNIPVGGAIVPEGNVAAIVTTALVLRYHSSMVYFNSVMVLAVIYGIGISYLGGELVVLYRRLNVGFLHWVLAGLRKMRTTPLSLAPFGSVILYFTLMFILIFTGLGLGDLIFQRIVRMPPEWDVYFRYGLVGILGLGAGLVISLYKQRDDRFLLATGFLIGGIVFLLR